MGQHWLKTLRKQAGIESQDDFAAQLQLHGLDVTRSTIGHWEQGRYTPDYSDPKIRIALAKVLRINVRTLLKLAGYEVEYKHTEIAEKIAEIVDQLPAQSQELALKLVEQLRS